MNNFKSGSGNLDFGEGSNDNTEGETATEAAGSQVEKGTSDPNPEPVEGTTSTATTRERRTEPAEDRQAETYPYFVRRNNVGDERDTRLEIHVRDKVADQETDFRNALATQLGVSEISKTDAREFALLAAFRHPERVAELMRDEGFGAVE